MNPKASAHADPQRDLFRIELQHLVDRRHPLVGVLEVGGEAAGDQTDRVPIVAGTG